ncbi:hypothetical protein DXG01_004787 [Tephrocybe rancida]|nr:hypothetical protein DXG01_004787 [Tephrocybe rancida]
MKYPVPIPTAPPPLTDTERGDLASAIECFDFQGPTTLERIHLTLPVLIHLAFFIIDNYDYTDNAIVPVYRPRKATPATPRNATPEEIKYSKKFLKACVLVSRATVIRNTNLDSQAAWLIAAHRRFIQELLTKAKSKLLFEHYLVLYSLVEDAHAQTKTASPAITIAGARASRHTGSLSRSVRTKVAERDQHCCKISGTLDTNDSGDVARLLNLVRNARGPLEAARGTPWLPRTKFFGLLRDHFGVTLPSSTTDIPENALLLHISLHRLFSDFEIGFLMKSDDDTTMVMRIRESRRTRAMQVLAGVLPNVDIPDRQGTHLDGQALLPDCPNSPVPALDPAWFHLHWWLGDIFHMASGAEPRDLDEDDDSDEDQIEIRYQQEVTQTSIHMLDA